MPEISGKMYMLTASTIDMTVKWHEEKAKKKTQKNCDLCLYVSVGRSLLVIQISWER